MTKKSTVAQLKILYNVIFFSIFLFVTVSLISASLQIFYHSDYFLKYISDELDYIFNVDDTEMKVSNRNFDGLFGIKLLNVNFYKIKKEGNVNIEKKNLLHLEKVVIKPYLSFKKFSLNFDFLLKKDDKTSLKIYYTNSLKNIVTNKVEYTSKNKTRGLWITKR